jgi:hypothetical protein
MRESDAFNEYRERSSPRFVGRTFARDQSENPGKPKRSKIRYIPTHPLAQRAASGISGALKHGGPDTEDLDGPLPARENNLT